MIGDSMIYDFDLSQWCKLLISATTSFSRIWIILREWCATLWFIFLNKQLITILNLEWDADGRACLNTFQNIRDSLSVELNIPQSANVGLLEEYDAKKIALPSYEIIVAEVRSRI